MPSANPINTGIKLFISGQAFPVGHNDSKTLHIRGTTI